jgi:hypothetical protein
VRRLDCIVMVLMVLAVNSALYYSKSTFATFDDSTR